MRLSAAVLSFLAVSVAASTLEKRQSPFPSCALPCIANADLGGCVATDTTCTCKNSKFVDSVTRCVYADCTGTDLTNALQTAQKICTAVGVTLTSTPVLTPTGSATSTASASNTAGTSTSKGNGASSSTHLNTLSAISALGLVALSLSFL